MRRCASCLSPITSKKVKCESCRFDNSKIRVIKSVIPPGRVLDGRYYIGNVLGQGGFGITYKGFDQDLNRLVAIKEYYPKHNVERSGKGLSVSPSNNSEFKRGLNYFTDEARALARFQAHRNIVSVLSYFKSNNTSPYVLGLTFSKESEAEEAFSRLKNLHIPVTSWPDLPPEVISDSQNHKLAISLRKSSIFLPVHRSINSEQIRTLNI